MLVSLAVGNSVNPVFGLTALISSFSITLICLFAPPFCSDIGLESTVFEAGFI
jgi:hypothetical protein